MKYFLYKNTPGLMHGMTPAGLKWYVQVMQNNNKIVFIIKEEVHDGGQVLYVTIPDGLNVHPILRPVFHNLTDEFPGPREKINQADVEMIKNITDEDLNKLFDEKENPPAKPDGKV